MRAGEEIDAVAREWTAGGLAAGAGLLLPGLGTVLYFQLDPVTPAAPVTGVTWMPGGAGFSIAGSF